MGAGLPARRRADQPLGSGLDDSGVDEAGFVDPLNGRVSELVFVGLGVVRAEEQVALREDDPDPSLRTTSVAAVGVGQGGLRSGWGHGSGHVLNNTTPGRVVPTQEQDGERVDT